MLNPLALKLEQFTRFDPSERTRLDELIHTTRRFARGEQIIAAGKRPDHVHLVIDGLATRAKMLGDGQRQLMAFLIPGDLCDVEVFVLEAMDHDIVALAETKCALIAADDMEHLLGESSNLTRAIWWSTMTDSAVLREWIVNHGVRDALGRVAHIFCELLIRYRIIGMARDNCIPFPLTQEDLADATGMTPVHLNRVLQQLRAHGLIDLNSRTLTILDFPRLGEIAQYEPSYLHLIRTQKADPAVAERVGDLVPPAGRGAFASAWEKVTDTLG